MPVNDNDPRAPAPAPDAHGRAALLLVESLIHELCEGDVLTADQAIEVAERAVDVQAEQAEAADGASAPLWSAHALLTSIATSLRIDGQTASAP